MFYHLTYEGAVDVASITDPIELKALETQVWVGTAKLFNFLSYPMIDQLTASYFLRAHIIRYNAVFNPAQDMWRTCVYST